MSAWFVKTTQVKWKKLENSDNKTASLFLSFYEKFNPDALQDKRRAKVKITRKNDADTH